ncbi:MAG: glycerophosphodiester phosphodiesterase, partial [Calditrichales bacterium]
QITSAYVEKLSTDGFDCYIWTVDNPPDAAYFIETGVCALTTNRPDWLREQLDYLI